MPNLAATKAALAAVAALRPSANGYNPVHFTTDSTLLALSLGHELAEVLTDIRDELRLARREREPRDPAPLMCADDFLARMLCLEGVNPDELRDDAPLLLPSGRVAVRSRQLGPMLFTPRDPRETAAAIRAAQQLCE